jgi:hypothetical protein
MKRKMKKPLLDLRFNSNIAGIVVESQLDDRTIVKDASYNPAPYGHGAASHVSLSGVEEDVFLLSIRKGMGYPSMFETQSDDLILHIIP